ncbi:unnamed protein product, partial [Bubo scandiacus]
MDGAARRGDTCTSCGFRRPRGAGQGGRGFPGGGEEAHPEPAADAGPAQHHARPCPRRPWSRHCASCTPARCGRTAAWRSPAWTGRRAPGPPAPRPRLRDHQLRRD